jgi:hypothetical protein
VGLQFFFLLLCAWQHRSFAAIPTKYYKIHPSSQLAHASKLLLWKVGETNAARNLNARLLIEQADAMVRRVLFCTFMTRVLGLPMVADVRLAAFS